MTAVKRNFLSYAGRRAVALFILWTWSLVPVAGQKVVRVTAPGVHQPAEVSIAINPKRPDNLVGASYQPDQPPQPRGSSYLYVTNDGGLTWRTVPNQNPQRLTQGDDMVTFDGQGVLYHTHLSFTGIRVPRPPRAESGILVSASSDGGLTWGGLVPAINHVNSVTPFEDKPAIVTDNAPDSPYRNNVYLAWTRFDVYGSPDPEHKSHIYFTRSTDGGKTFAMPFRISEAAGDCRDSDNTVEGAVPAVGPKGEVYVVWAGAQGLIFDKSLDGGVTFGPDQVIGNMPGGWDITVAGIDRSNGMPVTGVDLSSGPNRGTLYVNWVDERNGDPDVFVMSSRDGGASWSPAVRVNDDPLHNGRAQFFTWMAVDPVDGSVNVAFYDRREGTGTQTRIILARSIDGGRTFVNHKVELAPFSCNERVFFGDYIGVAAYGGRVVPMFMHFTGPQELAISVARFRFTLRTQNLLP